MQIWGNVDEGGNKRTISENHQRGFLYLQFANTALVSLDLCLSLGNAIRISMSSTIIKPWKMNYAASYVQSTGESLWEFIIIVSLPWNITKVQILIMNKHKKRNTENNAYWLSMFQIS